jgi:hypothetical protein
VRNRTPELPFVLMSAVVTSEMQSDASWGHASAVVSKDDLGHDLHVLFPPHRAQLRASA